MFIYADESGHTGRNIFDAPSQYRVGAILSVKDAEEALSKLIKPEIEKLGKPRLHGNELGPSKVAELLPKIFQTLSDNNDWMFLLGSIEKDYIAPTKFVDLIFDHVENQAVPPLWYNMSGFRHALCLTMDQALRDVGRRKFWDAYLCDDIAAIRSTVRSAHQYIRMREADPRLRQIAKDAFEYALLHPDDFTLLATKGRRAYQGHTPNMIAFSFLFEAIHLFADKTGAKPIAFIHDQQTEFGTSMKEWAELFGSVKHKDVKGFPSFSIVDYALPKLMLPSSKDVFSLQAVDLILWAMGRAEKELAPALESISNLVYPYEISRNMSGMIVKAFQAQLNKPITKKEEAAGKALRADWESERLKKIRTRRFGKDSEVNPSNTQR